MLQFNFSVGNIVAAIAAGASAFGVAYNLAATNATPGVQSGEWMQIILTTLVAMGAAFYHQDKPTA